MNVRTVAWLMLVLSISLVAFGCDGDDAAPGASPTSQAGSTNEVATPTAEEGAGAVGLTWWGHAMFVVTTPEGTSILLDPYGDIGYRVPAADELSVDVVTLSHEHPDHNNVALGGDATVLRGITADGWAEIDKQLGGSDVRIRTVSAFHDDSEGSERGRNAVFETGGLRIVHLGDLGQPLTQEQIDAIGSVDVLLVPTGGVFTIDAAGATEVVGQLAPRIAIPMHYKTEALTFALELGDAFLEGRQVEQVGSAVELTPNDLPAPGSAAVWVLEPAGG